MNLELALNTSVRAWQEVRYCIEDSRVRLSTLGELVQMVEEHNPQLKWPLRITTAVIGFGPAKIAIGGFAAYSFFFGDVGNSSDICYDTHNIPYTIGNEKVETLRYTDIIIKTYKIDPTE